MTASQSSLHTSTSRSAKADNHRQPSRNRRRASRTPSASTARSGATTAGESVPSSGVRSVKAKQAPKAGYDPLVLLDRYQHLVRQIVGGFQRKLPRNVLRDDLMAAGMSGLWDAVRKHGHEAGGNFDWYVRVRIRGAILDELRAQDWLPRRARAAAAGATQEGKASAPPVVLRFDEVSETEQARCLTAGESSSTEKAVEESFTKQRLASAMNQLPDRERRIVAMHYFRGIKFKDLGEMLGVSEPRISQLHSRAMSRLKVILADAA